MSLDVSVGPSNRYVPKIPFAGFDQYCRAVTSPHAGYYPADQRYYAPAGTSGLAIAAFVLGLLGVWPLAIIFAIFAILSIRRTRRGGKGLVIAGLILSLLWMVVQVGLVVLIGVVVNDVAKPLTPGKQGALFQVSQGDCFNIGAGGPNDVTGALCTEPHDGQVILTFDIPNGPWPGTAEIDRLAGTGCQDRIAARLANRVPPNLELSASTPKQLAWAAGNRSVHCALHTTNGAKLTKSLLPGA